MKSKPVTQEKQPDNSAIRITSSEHENGMFITNNESTATIKSNVDLATLISPVMSDDATIKKNDT